LLLACCLLRGASVLLFVCYVVAERFGFVVDVRLLFVFWWWLGLLLLATRAVSFGG